MTARVAICEIAPRPRRRDEVRRAEPRHDRAPTNLTATREPRGYFVPPAAIGRTHEEARVSTTFQLMLSQNFAR